MQFQQVDLNARLRSHSPKIEKTNEKLDDCTQWAILMPWTYSLSKDFHKGGSGMPLWSNQNQPRLKTGLIKWQPLWEWIVCCFRWMVGQKNVSNSRYVTTCFQSTACHSLKFSPSNGTKWCWASQHIRLCPARDNRFGWNPLWNSYFSPYCPKITTKSPHFTYRLLPYAWKSKEPLPAHPTDPSRNHWINLSVTPSPPSPYESFTLSLHLYRAIFPTQKNPLLDTTQKDKVWSP
jgi:hypothetical protein